VNSRYIPDRWQGVTSSELAAIQLTVNLIDDLSIDRYRRRRQKFEPHAVLACLGVLLQSYTKPAQE